MSGQHGAGFRVTGCHQITDRQHRPLFQTLRFVSGQRLDTQRPFRQLLPKPPADCVQTVQTGFIHRERDPLDLPGVAAQQIGAVNGAVSSRRQRLQNTEDRGHFTFQRGGLFFCNDEVCQSQNPLRKHGDPEALCRAAKFDG